MQPLSGLTDSLDELSFCLNVGMFRAVVPSGASTGIYEALELRDVDNKQYHKKGWLTYTQFYEAGLHLGIALVRGVSFPKPTMMN